MSTKIIAKKTNFHGLNVIADISKHEGGFGYITHHHSYAIVLPKHGQPVRIHWHNGGYLFSLRWKDDGTVVMEQTGFGTETPERVIYSPDTETRQQAKE